MIDGEAGCPRCGSTAVRKDGLDRKGTQAYRCRDCRRCFTARSTTPFSGYRFPPELIALAVRWYLRYRLSYADVAELLAERGVRVDPSSVYAWVQEFAPLYEAAARVFRRAVGERWSVDETYVKVAGDWAYVYRALDEQGQVVDVYVSAERAAEDAAAFFRRAIETTGVPPTGVTTDCAAAYPPALAAVLPDVLHETGKRPSSASSGITSISRGASAGCAASRPSPGHGCCAARTLSCAISVVASTTSRERSPRHRSRECLPWCRPGRRSPPIY